MAVDDPMTVDECCKYLRQTQRRYFKANCTGRSQLYNRMWLCCNFFQPAPASG